MLGGNFPWFILVQEAIPACVSRRVLAMLGLSLMLLLSTELNHYSLSWSLVGDEQDVMGVLISRWECETFIHYYECILLREYIYAVSHFYPLIKHDR